jgi:hypothetical protein
LGKTGKFASIVCPNLVSGTNTQRSQTNTQS